jgi:isopenicillin N synthase-like dioxygenase
MSSFSSIPILDLSLARDPTTKPEFLQELRHALLEVGFLYIKNIGIPEDLIQNVIEQGIKFFDIPDEEKYVSCLHFRYLSQFCFLVLACSP